MGFGGVASAAPYHMKLVAKIHLPTKVGHGDMVAYDPGTNYLYVSEVDGMAVVNAATNKVVKNFPEIAAPNQPCFDKDYVYENEAEGPGAGKKNAIVTISKKTWKVVSVVPTKGTSPDGAFIDTANNKLYEISDDNNWIEEYTTGAHPKLVKVMPEVPEKTIAGPDVAALIDGTIYATNDAYVEKINPNSGAVEKAANYHLKLVKHGGTKDMFWDKYHKAIWVVTANGAGVFVIDPKTLDVLKVVPETKGGDAASLDKGLGLAYVFEGGLPGFDVYDVKNEKLIDTVKTGMKKPTHSGVVDSRSHEVYAYVGGEAELWVYKPVK
ncbi:MAG: hypothetical protein KGQ58_09195 [Proteobacteria bacterium]|nr:hypothetical protein [Pseudomonadota bacterium]